MSNVASEVKRYLLLAREENDKGALTRAFQTIQSSADHLGKSAELLTLCCEEAIALSAWPIAEACGDLLTGLVAPTHALQARSLFCAALLRLHAVPVMLRGEALVDECALCVTSVVKGITMLIDEWPHESEVLVDGLTHLWRVTEPLYVRGLHKAILDVVEFAATLVERLMIGGGYTYIQWVTRYAVCLRSVGRLSEAVAQLNSAADAAQRLGEERLHVQVLRMLAVASVNRDVSGVVLAKSSGRNDAVTVSKAPLQYIMNATQSFLVSPAGGPAVALALPELQLVFDILTGSTAEATVPLTSVSSTGGSRGGNTTSATAASGASTGKGTSSKPKVARSGGGGALDGLVLPSADIREELLSDVVLCLAVCGDAARCQQVIPTLLRSQNLRAKTFAAFGQVVLDGRAAGLMNLWGALDASYVTSAIRQECRRCIRLVEDTLDTAKMISDPSERAYAIRTGSALLWLLCLPLLQSDTHRQVRHTLARVVTCMSTYPGTPLSLPLQVRCEYESAVAEFDEDNLSVAVQEIQRALSRGGVAPSSTQTSSVNTGDANANATGGPSSGDAVIPSMDFPLLWLLRRAQVRQVSDPATLDSAEAQALHSLEQSKIVSTSSKRLALLKACFNRLPPLQQSRTVADHRDDTSVGDGAQDTAPSRQGNVAPSAGKRGALKSRSASLMGADTPVDLPPRRSLAELYAALLAECCRVDSELGPSLIPIAKSTAEALCAITVSPSDPYAGDYLRLKAEAALSHAKVLCKEEESFKEALEKAALRPQLIASLLLAADLSVELFQRGYASGWIAVSACQLFLNWRAAAFLSGDFSGGVCVEADALHRALWHCGADVNREWSLATEMALVVVTAHVSEYFAARGEDTRVAVGASTGAPAMQSSSTSPRHVIAVRPRSFDDTIRQLLQATKGEANSAHLKRALEVCHEAIDTIDLPSHKVSLLLLYPSLLRLSGGVGGGAAPGKTELTLPPQTQLLFLLARLQGPMPLEEKRAALETQCVELLKADPAIELCGRVALVAHELKEERIVIAVCELAHDLYHSGKLGWGTRFAPLRTTVAVSTTTPADQDSGGSVRPSAQGPPAGTNSSGSVKKSLSHTAAAAASSQSFTAIYPRPTESDWMWFSRVQLLQAELCQQRVVGMHADNRDKVNLRVLQLCTNAAIAATRGLPASVYTGLADALVIYAATIVRLQAAEYEASQLHPSLKMMLSSQILTPLGRLARQGHGATSLGAATPSSIVGAQLSRQDTSVRRQEEVIASVVTIGQSFLRCCASLGLLNDSVTVLEQLFRFLPTRLHKVFKVEDARIRCQLGMSTTSVTRSARNDDPDTEASVWVTVAQHTANREQSMSAWKCALTAVANYPRPKAEVLLALAEHLMVSQSDGVSYNDVKVILLSALDNIQGFHGTTTTVPTGARSTASGVSPGDQGLGVLQQCGLDPHKGASFGESFRNFARRNSVPKGTLSGTQNSLGTARGGAAGPLSVNDLLLALRIAYCLFVIADPFPRDADAPAPAPASPTIVKEDVALLVSHYVDRLWYTLHARVMAAGRDGHTRTASDEAASPASANGRPASPPTPTAWSIPVSPDDWFGIRAPSAFTHALGTALSMADREAMSAPSATGTLFRVARYLQECGRDTHSFLLYSWLDLCAQVAFPAEDPRGLCLQRAACWQAHLCAVRCGAGKLGMIYDVPATPATHWRRVDEQLRSRGSLGAQPGSADVDASSSRHTRQLQQQRHGAVEIQPSLGSLADFLLYEAEALASFGQVEEASLIAGSVCPWAEGRCDRALVARCYLLLAARHIVHGEWREAVAQLDTLERGRPSVLSALTAEDAVRWHVEKVVFLVHAGRAAEVPSVTDVVETAAARITATSNASSADSLSNTLSRTAARALILQYASEVVAFLTREDIQICRWAADDGARAAQAQALQTELLRLVSHLSGSSHPLHHVQATLARADPLLRPDYSDLWSPLPLSVDDVQSALEALAKEDTAISELTDAIHGDSTQSASDVCRGGQTGPGTTLCTGYTRLESRLSGLRARNDMARLRLADWVLRRYRSLTMEELGLPTGGPAALEKHVMEFVRDPVQPTDTAAKDTALLHLDWSSYGHGEVPEEIKNAFAHFSLSLQTVATASRLRADVSLRGALDAVPSGPHNTRRLEQLCELETRRMFEESMQPDRDGGLDVAATVETALADAWSKLPQFQIPEKVIHRGKSGDKTKRNNPGSHRTGSVTELTVQPSRALTDAQYQLAAHLRDLLFRYQFDFAFDRLHAIAVLFANACAYWQRPNEAAVAIEAAQAAQLCDVLFDGCRALFAATAEAQLWRKYEYARLRLAAFSSSTPFAHLRQALLDTSPALAQMCVLCGSADVASMAGSDPTPSSASGRVGHGKPAPAPPPAAAVASLDALACGLHDPLVEGATFTVARAEQTDTFLVSVRTFDGAVYVRRVRLSQTELDHLTQRLHASLTTVQARAALTGHDKERDVAAATTVEFLQETGAFLRPLWNGLEDALGSTSTRQPLFLCLSPALGPLPIEHLAPFNGLHAVQRELGVRVIQMKQANKVSRASAAGAVLIVVDPYGDHPSSVQAVCPTEGKGKYADILTSVNGARPFSDAFLAFKLQSAATINSVLIATCGSGASTLTPTLAANLRLDHLNAVVMMDGGVTDTSLRRDQRFALSSDSASARLAASWLAPLLLLARGVRSVAASTFPMAPSELDVIAKRASTALASGRSALEACAPPQGKAKNDSRQKEYITLYGVSSLSTKAK